MKKNKRLESLKEPLFLNKSSKKFILGNWTSPLGYAANCRIVNGKLICIVLDPIKPPQ